MLPSMMSTLFDAGGWRPVWNDSIWEALAGCPGRQNSLMYCVYLMSEVIQGHQLSLVMALALCPRQYGLWPPANGMVELTW